MVRRTIVWLIGSMHGCFVRWTIVWLIGWILGASVEQLIDRLLDWLAEFLIGSSVKQFVERLLGWSSEYLDGLSVKLSVDRLWIARRYWTLTLLHLINAEMVLVLPTACICQNGVNVKMLTTWTVLRRSPSQPQLCVSRTLEPSPQLTGRLFEKYVRLRTQSVARSHQEQ